MQNFIYLLMEIMTLSTLIFTELTIASQNFHPKFVENMERRVINLFNSSR